MASIYSVLITAYLHIILRVSLFINQEEPVFTQVPNLASWIFLMGLIDLIWHTRFTYIDSFHLPRIAGIAVEILMSIFLSEFGLLVVWTAMENVCSAVTIWFLMALRFYPNRYTSFILGLTTTILSVSCILSMAVATDQIYFIRKRGRFLIHRLYCIVRSLKQRFFASKNKCQINEIHITQDLITPKRNYCCAYSRRSRCREHTMRRPRCS